jgi:3-dehydroquinate dehydratase
MLELRLDLMGSFRLKEMIEMASKPVIVTYRSKKEGGKGMEPLPSKSWKI